MPRCRVCRDRGWGGEGRLSDQVPGASQGARANQGPPAQRPTWPGDGEQAGHEAVGTLGDCRAQPCPKGQMLTTSHRFSLCENVRRWVVLDLPGSKQKPDLRRLSKLSWF